MAVNRNFTENYKIGGGQLYIKYPENDNFQYFGQTNAVNISVKTEKVEHTNTENATQTEDLQVTKSVSAEVKFTTNDLRKEVIALAFAGKNSVSTQSSGSQSDYDLGKVKGLMVYDLDNKVKVYDVVVKYDDDDDDSTDPKIAVEGVDYSVDYEYGSIEIAENSACIGHDTKVDFKYKEATIIDYTSLDETSKEVSLMFRSNPQHGKPMETLIKRIILSLDGDFSLKDADKITELSFSGKVLKDPETGKFIVSREIG